MNCNSSQIISHILHSPHNLTNHVYVFVLHRSEDYTERREPISQLNAILEPESHPVAFLSLTPPVKPVLIYS